MIYDDVVIELARTERELTQRVERRIRQQQLGVAWNGIERRTGEADMTQTEARTMLTDKEWAEKHGIVCHAPDGANRCEGCAHYYGRSDKCVHAALNAGGNP